MVEIGALIETHLLISIIPRDIQIASCAASRRNWSNKVSST